MTTTDWALFALMVLTAIVAFSVAVAQSVKFFKTKDMRVMQQQTRLVGITWGGLLLLGSIWILLLGKSLENLICLWVPGLLVGGFGLVNLRRHLKRWIEVSSQAEANAGDKGMSQDPRHRQDH